jgi:hypothetical protein
MQYTQTRVYLKFFFITKFLNLNYIFHFILEVIFSMNSCIKIKLD